jgi:hypothetical protein
MFRFSFDLKSGIFVHVFTSQYVQAMQYLSTFQRKLLFKFGKIGAEPGFPMVMKEA